MNMNLSKLWETAKDKGAWRAAVQGVTESGTTEGLNNNQLLTISRWSPIACVQCWGGVFEGQLNPEPPSAKGDTCNWVLIPVFIPLALLFQVAGLLIPRERTCVCVCVCVCERERERERWAPPLHQLHLWGLCPASCASDLSSREGPSWGPWWRSGFIHSPHPWATPPSDLEFLPQLNLSSLAPPLQKSISHMVPRAKLKPKSKVFATHISDKGLISRL